MHHHQTPSYAIPDHRLFEYVKNDNGILLITPPLKDRKQNRNFLQPKCSLEVCKGICPYKGKPFQIEIIRMDNGHDAVVLSKETSKNVFTGCLIAYTRKRYRPPEAGKEWDFLKKHVARVMGSCPLKMEHEMLRWNHSTSGAVQEKRPPR